MLNTVCCPVTYVKVLDVARGEAQSYRRKYDEGIPLKVCDDVYQWCSRCICGHGEASTGMCAVLI